ncbi:MAG: DUF6174 domain-containing protein [Gemmatimonadota bacterium]
MNEIRRWLLGALAPLLAIACSDATGPGVSFDLAEARWMAEGPSHYQYVYDLSCECGVTGPVRLNVENGVVTAFTPLPGSFTAGGAPEPSDFPTIDDLFARLRAEAEADAVQFDVEYDDDLGYPTRASVDVRAEIADDEYTFRVTDFQELEPLTE